MKWFKHLSIARNDEKISQLEDRCGLEGYGFYFKMLEIIAESMDSTDKCEVIYSLSRWGRHTNITSKKWLFLSQCCSDVGLMTVRRMPDKLLSTEYQIAVNIPNILKHRDNYTKNLQLPCKQEVEVEVEVEKILKPLAKAEKKPSAHAVQFSFETGEFENINGQMVIWEKAYAAVNIQGELNKAASWLIANPKNRKSNYNRFLSNWLSRVQDKAPAQGGGSKPFDVNEFMKKANGL